jgi:MFS superfamily sulfate permease-like transporter
MWNEGDSAILKLWFTLTHLKFANSYSCAIAIPGLSFLFIFSYFRNRYIHNKIFKFFPFVLFLVIISILISWGFDLESKGVIVLGYIDGGFQRPAQFRFDYMGDLIVGSLVITIVGFLESVVCAKKFADKNG